MAESNATPRRSDFKDLTGLTFNCWSVLHFDHLRKNASFWLCRCECGAESTVEGYQLTSGRSRQCGRCGRQRKPEDVTGMQFNSWTVLRYDEKRKKQHYWICRCACGREASVRAPELKNGGSKQCRSCGTSNRDDCDGHSKTPEYMIWHYMMQRCENPNSTHYSYYGGRGITVCDRWRESFADFLEDMGSQPTPQYSLDRFPDNNKGYEPGNVRWATHTEQMRNRRNNRLLTLDGETRCLTEWAKILGVPYEALRGRIRQGWSAERALTEPFNER